MLGVPRAPAWRRLWLQTALTGTAILLAIFGGYEVVERTFLADAPASVTYVLHMARGMGASVVLGTWGFFLAMRTRRFYERVLNENIRSLETEVHARTLELEESQAFLEHLFDSLRDRVLVIDRQGRVVKANRVARESGGPDLVGNVCAKVMKECGERCCAHAVMRGERDDAHAIRNDPRTGRIWAIDTYPMHDAEGQPQLVLEVGRDVTEERELEAQMRHQEKMASLGVLAAGIAHDIGNPLASLSSELELLDYERDPRVMHDSLGVLRTHVDRIARTLREMVDFARRRGEESTEVSIANAVDDSLRLVRHDRRMRDVTLVTDVPRDLPPVHMVEDHLVLVLVNLVLNALDAMPAGGTLEVRAKRDGNEAHLFVRDTGVGMSAQTRSRVFEPLFTTKRESGGTGLGLTVSHNVVRSVGGRMSIESEPGRGTTIELVLPLLVPSPVPSLVPSASGSAS
ncbi:MAG: PAS domain-containing protein [Sandaracinaceae bacterium]|nr:PAS domain-containing protein [Sandaracinaceae bacterium]